MGNTPFIIGLTGNIATGKSVVRRMLANVGALGIDADLVAHRTLYPGGSAYQAVIDAFGKKILRKDGSISRPILGKIVFSDPKKLAQLEALTHPAVEASIKERIRKTTCPIVVIEAIKLLEAGLDAFCDSIWVSHASYQTQVNRLVQTRHMTEPEAITRITAQPPQSEKRSRANVVINTEGTFFSTWTQIQAALNDTITINQIKTSLYLKSLKEIPANQLERFWKSHTSGEDLYEHLGSMMGSPIIHEGELQSLLLWQNWNFTAALGQRIGPGENWHISGNGLSALEAHARAKQCELLLVPRQLAELHRGMLAESGFTKYPIAKLAYPAWEGAARRMAEKYAKKVWTKVLSQPFEMERI